MGDTCILTPEAMAEARDIEYIRNTYRVPAQAGQRVSYTGGAWPKTGTITGAQGSNLLIRLDGDTTAMPYHPTWELTYLEESAP